MRRAQGHSARLPGTFCGSTAIKGAFILCGYWNEEKKQCRGDLYLELFLQCLYHPIPSLVWKGTHQEGCQHKHCFRLPVFQQMLFSRYEMSLSVLSALFSGKGERKRYWTHPLRVWALRIAIVASALASTLSQRTARRPVLLNIVILGPRQWRGLLCI